MIKITRLSHEEIFLIAEIEAMSNVLESATRLTGMRFAAISHMTETHWTACAVRDELQFSINVGDSLDIEKTLCGALRINPRPIIIESISNDSDCLGHDFPKLYGFESFVSLPIVFLDGSLFGSLCMLDYLPKRNDDPRVVDILTGIVRLFSIALELRQIGGCLASFNKAPYLKGKWES